MEWLTCIRKTLEYVEEHLKEDISIQELGRKANVSPMFLQKGFSIMTGYGIGEYIRNRRLYLAALDLVTTEEKIIDIAYDYQYETPESFSKAFSRFHGATPSQIRQKEAPIKPFLPLKINIVISGGDQMECSIVSKKALRAIGFRKVLPMETSMKEVPLFWDEVFRQYVEQIYRNEAGRGSQQQAILNYGIGDYGICVDGEEPGTICYYIAGEYTGGEVPEGMYVLEYPACDWAVFDCIGAIPDSIHKLTEKIYKEWLPGNPDYELCGNINVEWYDRDNGEKEDPYHHTQVWIPVRRK